MNKIAFKVKKVAEKSILQGHPWVYESSIIKQSKQGEAGDVAIIFNQRKNQFLAIGLYDPHSVIRIKIIHKGNSAKIDKFFFFSKFQDALEIRKPLLETDTSAFRLIYGENDGLPGLIVDVYNDHTVIKLYSAIWLPFLGDFKEILRELLEIKVIILRLNRLLQKSNLKVNDGDVILGQLENEDIIFKEHGLKFKANLIKGHKTGYFLDHRNNRFKVRGLSKEKAVLDIYSYAGGFSVNALAGGARSVTSLDISGQALALAEENATLNDLAQNHKIMVSDAFEGIQSLARRKQKFNLIICDPPSFAKSENQIEKAIQSYRQLVRNLLPIIERKGILLMASCSSRVSKEVFYELVIEEIELSKRRYQILEKATHDIDHPEGIPELSYLKSIYIQFD